MLERKQHIPTFFEYSFFFKALSNVLAQEHQQAI
jgi:hypothetical protein